MLSGGERSRGTVSGAEGASARAGEVVTPLVEKRGLIPPELASYIRRSVMSRGILRWATVKASYKVGQSEEGSWLRLLLGRLHGELCAEVTASEVLAVLRALGDAGIRCWLVGGWGVDALVARQTRRHHDLDLVVDDFAQRSLDARAVLATLGFNMSREHHFSVWMPDRWQMYDSDLRAVDLLSIDWARTSAALGRGEGLDGDELYRATFTEGVVAGERVPCLSAAVQLLYHSGFAPSPAQRHDIALLKGLLGAGEAALPEVQQ